MNDPIALSARWRFVIEPAARRGHAGRTLGRGAGASLEFEDRRGYVPGDDLRHLDWRAYARTDELLVRRYREEIQPRVEIILDLSRSMTSDELKATTARRLARLIAECARGDHLATRVLGAGDTPLPIEVESIDSNTPHCDGRIDLASALRGAASQLRVSCHVVLISDLLAAFEPRALLSALAARAGTLTVIMVLSPHDADPPNGAYRLMDAESEATLDLALDATAIASYRSRLSQHIGGIAEEVRRSGGRFVSLIASDDLDGLCRGGLQPSRILEPR